MPQDLSNAEKGPLSKSEGDAVLEEAKVPRESHAHMVCCKEYESLKNIVKTLLTLSYLQTYFSA